VGAGVRKEDATLKEKLNAAIKAVRTNGAYKQINDKYFNFDAYGTAPAS
jgi:polar amino acid transport system substrate-binding protein